MKPMKLSKLLYHLYDTALYTDVMISGLAIDSRKVKPGDLFFAYPGVHLDGRDFIDDAIQKGAAAILAETNAEQTTFKTQHNVPVYPVKHLSKWVGVIASEFYHNPSKKMKMVGFTGTNGKTSCSHFLAASLQRAGKVCGVLGTLGNGLYGEIEPGQLTTPDALTLQATLASLLEKKADIISMEVSSHSLEQGRVNGVHFDIGVFTNLTRDHLDYHGSMEAYGAAKRKLFEKSFTKNRVINIDDAFGKQLIFDLASENETHLFACCTQKITVPDSVSLILAEKIKLDHSGISAHVVTPWGQGKLKLPLLGEFNLNNSLAVLTSLCLLNIPLDEALNYLTQLQSVPGRMEMLGGGSKPLVVVDYAHTPDALEKVLKALKTHCAGKLLCLFGCGGDRDKGKRPMMAKVAETFADVIVVSDDNPRTENAAHIVQDIIEGFSHPEKIRVEHDRSKAIRDIIQCAKAGDCILIAGKGAELYQQIGNQKFPFNDAEKVRENLGDK